jgi:hypothetical protein
VPESVFGVRARRFGAVRVGSPFLAQVILRLARTAEDHRFVAVSLVPGTLFSVTRRTIFEHWRSELLNVDSRQGSLQSAAKQVAAVTQDRLDLGALAGPRRRDEPGLRWVPYKEAFSPALVREVLDCWGEVDGPLLDPFAGSGTSLFVSVERNIAAIGVELLPYPQWAAQTLLDARFADAEPLREICYQAIQGARRRRRSNVRPAIPAPAAQWALPVEVADTVVAVRSRLPPRGSSTEADLAHLALLSVVESVSTSVKDGTSLRHRSRSRAGRTTRPGRKDERSSQSTVFERFRAATEVIADDLPKLPSGETSAIVYRGDARQLPLEDRSVGCVVFSPPYPNRYDYAAVYQLELAVGEFISDREELKAMRRSLLRSHLEAPAPVRPTLDEPVVVEVLRTVGKAAAHEPAIAGRTMRMLVGYFDDMRTVLGEIARVLRPGAPAACVVSTQTYFGVAVPTDVMLAALAQRVGLQTDGLWVLRHKRVAVQQRSRGTVKSRGGREVVLLLRKPR